MIKDGKSEKKFTNGQTSFCIKKLENELYWHKKSPSPITCRTSSRFTFSETEYHENEIKLLHEKLRELTTETTTMKSFVTEHILLVKNSVNDKFSNNIQLQKKSNEKHLTGEIRHLIEKNKIKNCIIQTLMENQNSLLKRIESIDGNYSESFSTQHAQSDNFITPRNNVKNRFVKVLRLTQETSFSH